jgi:hypothetical protein
MVCTSNLRSSTLLLLTLLLMMAGTSLSKPTLRRKSFPRAAIVSFVGKAWQKRPTNTSALLQMLVAYLSCVVSSANCGSRATRLLLPVIAAVTMSLPLLVLVLVLLLLLTVT